MTFWLGSVLRLPLRILMPVAFRMRALGVENVPEGGAIVAANHVSYADPVVLWTASPRPCRFMAKEELFEKGFMAWFAPRAGAFPVRRGVADREAIATASATLAAGDLVGMFPEGTRIREGETGEAHGGVAFIAIRTGAPVVPVGISGTDKIRPPGSRFVHLPRITVSFGVPIDPAEFTGGRRERVDAMTARIMERIAEELRRAKEA